MPGTDLEAQAVQPLNLPRRAPTRRFNMVTSLVDRHVAEGRGERAALRTERGTVSYGRLQAEMNRAGNALLGLGIEPEQRVALLLPDCEAFVYAFLGAMKIGAVPVPLNTLAPPSDLSYFLNDSRARVLVTTGALVQPLISKEAAGEVEVLGQVRAILLTDDHVGPVTRIQSFSELVEAASPELQAFATGVDEPCYWLYSSGTTGRPKGTVHLHGDMLACVAPYAQEVVGIGPDDLTFSVARLFFSYGLVNSLFLPLLAGASTVLIPDRPDPSRVLDIMRRHRPSLLFSVPTSYSALCAALEAGEQRDRPFDCLRLAVSAGEPLPEPLYRRWVGLTGIEVLDGLGSTEVGYIFISNRPGQVRPGSSGQPIGEHRARILDEEGRELAEGEEGELWVWAESTALHYWNDRERSKATFVGDWIRTGDLYRRDADGYYWYLGRTGDVFKASGQWVSPLEVESCLLEHPAVLECAVVAEAENGLLKPKAFVVRRPGQEAGASELQAHVRARLQPHKYPRWVEFVDELPKTATGKVQRYKLRGAGA